MISTALEPDRVIDDLRELASLTASEQGAQRVAFTPGWQRARAWLRTRLDQLPVEVVEDDAQNLWATLRGDVDPPLAIGSHLDSVPNGGWLDGALGVVAGLEILRAAGAAPSRSLLLVDWADEEGRFGHSLLGSSAAFGTLDVDALSAGGADRVLEIDQLVRAARQRPELHAYLELHIEQGPVLEEAGVPVAAVCGTFGVRRRRVTFRGTAAHAGATPLALRHDPVIAAARFILDARRIAEDCAGLVTVGVLGTEPSVPTAVSASCSLVVDLRHQDGAALEELERLVLDGAWGAAEVERVGLAQEALWAIDPIAFDETLVSLIAGLAADMGSRHPAMVSGPLHDAAQPASAGIPTAMIFVRSCGGLSHTPQEDSSEDDLGLGVRVLGQTVATVLG